MFLFNLSLSIPFISIYLIEEKKDLFCEKNYMWVELNTSYYCRLVLTVVIVAMVIDKMYLVRRNIYGMNTTGRPSQHT